MGFTGLNGSETKGPSAPQIHPLRPDGLAGFDWDDRVEFE